MSTPKKIPLVMEIPTFPGSSRVIDERPSRRYAAWPPAISELYTIGYITDLNGCKYSREIGRSTSFAGRILFQFGETFAHGDGDVFISTTSSTVAIVPEHQEVPTLSAYKEFFEDGSLKPFIPLIPGEEDKDGNRTCLKCFGGIVDSGEVEGNVAMGWIFFQKSKHVIGTRKHYFEYTGAARVYYDLETNKVTARRSVGRQELFWRDEPKYGTFSAFALDGYAYLFGNAADSTEIMLARVKLEWILDRERYAYWDGKRYQPDPDKAIAVMTGMRHGQIYQSKLFENKLTKRDWVVVGGSSSRDNKVLIGASARLEGPYKIVDLMNTFSLQRIPAGSFRYCVYPHPWAYNEEDSELMLTWSEGGSTGGVIAVKVKLKQTMPITKPRKFWSVRFEDAKKHTCCTVS